MRRRLLPRGFATAHSRGAAIIEFAILAPVMITLMCGLGDVALAIFARLLATSTAQSAADLATQKAQIQSSDLADIYNASYALMRPLSTGPMTLRITNVYSDGNGKAWVYWSCGHGGLAPYAAKSNVVTSPTNSPVANYLYLTNGTSNGVTYHGKDTSFIEVEANYTFTPPTGFVLNTTQVTYAVAYSLPRLSTYIGFPWDGVVGHYAAVPSATTTTNTLTTSAGGNTITCNYAT